MINLIFNWISIIWSGFIICFTLVAGVVVTIRGCINIYYDEKNRNEMNKRTQQIVIVVIKKEEDENNGIS